LKLRCRRLCDRYLLRRHEALLILVFLRGLVESVDFNGGCLLATRVVYVLKQLKTGEIVIMISIVRVVIRPISASSHCLDCFGLVEPYIWSWLTKDVD